MKRYTLCKLCFCMIGLLFLLQWAAPLPEASIPESSGGAVIASGTVARIEEKENEFYQKQIILSLHSAAFCGQSIPNEIKENETDLTGSGIGEKKYAEGILCYMAEGEEIPLIGEHIVVSGQPQAFEGRRNPGGFDAAAYYRAKGITFSMRKTKIRSRGETYSFFGQMLFQCSRHMSRILDEVCGEDSGVMRAMLLGDKTALSADRKGLYQKGGISHILAISGLHVSFLGMGLYRGLKRAALPVSGAAFTAGAFLFFYIVMTGASPSSCRAAMMVGVSLLADLLGRSYERMTALSVSALILVIKQPLFLKDSGFLLSYGAILGLELICPVLTDLWENRTARLFFAGGSVFLMTLPVMLAAFYEIPVYSFFLNLLVIPLMSAVIALGILSLAAGSLFLPLGRFLFYPVHLILSLFDVCCRLTEKLPGSMWVMGKPSWGQIILYFLMIGIFCLAKRYMTKPCALILLAGAVWIMKSPLPVADTVTMLDVGQGDGIVLQSRDGTAILIDGGSTSEKKLAQYTLLPYLKSQGIEMLDYVFLSHMDEDHISGVEELIQNGGEEHMRIGTLVLPSFARRDEVYDRIAAQAREAGIRLCTMEAGERLEAGGFSFTCLHPREDGLYRDRNEASLVLHVRKGRFSALFMGDLDGEAEAAFAERYPDGNGSVTVLKAGHHGAKASCSRTFLAKCSPGITLISCGEDNTYGHPDGDTIERILAAGSRVYVTKDAGAIRIWIGRERVRVTCTAAKG